MTATGPEVVLADLLASDARRVVVLDDDPTGSQSASDIDLLLEPSRADFETWLRGDERGIYVVTNTRALPEQHAVRVIRQTRDMAEAAAARVSARLAFVLRGDSTLRGHVFAEVAALAGPGDVVLVVPAFPAGGRITRDGVQLLDSGDGVFRNVADTEFAADPVFGFTARTMTDWVAAAGGPAAVRLVPLSAVRAGHEAVRDALLCAPEGGAVIPDAETDDDVATITAGLLAAENSGRAVTVRSAAPLAAVRVGTRSSVITEIPGGGTPVLVVCGSHTASSSRQLTRVIAEHGPPVVITTAVAVSGGAEREVAVAAAAAALRERLAGGVTAVLSSERLRHAHHDRLDHGAAVMATLTSVVAKLRDLVHGCVVKGGISSAETALHGLGGRSARVLGQLEVGVALWSLRVVPGRTIPFAVVPGNVGDDETLLRAVTAVRSGVARGARADDR